MTHHYKQQHRRRVITEVQSWTEEELEDILKSLNACGKKLLMVFDSIIAQPPSVHSISRPG